MALKQANIQLDINPEQIVKLLSSKGEVFAYLAYPIDKLLSHAAHVRHESNGVAECDCKRF